jgi:SAM-dependent methyltransferase
MPIKSRHRTREGTLAMPTDYDSREHWSSVGRQIRERRDGNRLAGDDDPYYHYKGNLVRQKFTPNLPVEGHSVLDVGCGAGGSLGGLRDRNPTRLAGCDQSPEMVKLASEYVPEAEIKLMDGTTLPYEDGEFDVVKTMTVLQHNPDDVLKKLVAEICRVASEYVVLCEDTESKWASRQEGTGVYKNCFGRPVEFYSALCAEHGWTLARSESLATRVSLRVSNLLRSRLSRGHVEGTPFSKVHLATERLTLHVTRQLDKVVPSRDWELTMMVFRPTASKP